MMPFIIIVLLGMLIGLQTMLWVGKGSYAEQHILQRMVTAQRMENEGLQQRNAALFAEVTDLQNGLDAVEERARYELGLIKRGEVFYQIVGHDE